MIKKIISKLFAIVKEESGLTYLGIFRIVDKCPDGLPLYKIAVYKNMDIDVRIGKTRRLLVFEINRSLEKVRIYWVPISFWKKHKVNIFWIDDVNNCVQTDCENVK